MLKNCIPLTSDHARGDHVFTFGSQTLSCALCSCSMLLGTMSTSQTPLIFSESGCLFSLILNIDLIFLLTHSIHAKIILIILLS